MKLAELKNTAPHEKGDTPLSTIIPQFFCLSIFLQTFVRIFILSSEIAFILKLKR